MPTRPRRCCNVPARGVRAAAARLTTWLLPLAVLLLPSVALAAPGGGLDAITGVGEEIVDWLLHRLGPIIFILGLVKAGFSWMWGRGDMTSAFGVMIAGIFIFAAPHIVAFVQSAVG